MVFPSLETTFRSERDLIYNSMIIENQFNNSCNTSLDISLFRPNVGNIPLRTLKELPFMLPNRVEDIIYDKKKGLYNKFDNKSNNTFVNCSYDKLNASANEAFYLQNIKNRKLKDIKKVKGTL